MKDKIFAEEPEVELWRNLLKYSYKSNIKKYFEEHDHIIIENDDSENSFDVVANAIAGAILQADEYYRASKTVSLHVEPLMLYYGTSNLMYAMSLLLRGHLINIKSHGMRIEIERTNKQIADTKIFFSNSSDGGVHVYAKDMGLDKNLCSYNFFGWTLSDFFDSIAEICEDYDRCYKNRLSKVFLIDAFNTADGVVEKMWINDEQIEEIQCIEDFNKAYLRPQRLEDSERGAYLVLRRRINGKDISRVSYSEQPYLCASHTFNGKHITIPEEINMFISLFALGNLCRYHPDVWYPFVTSDVTGEKLLIEKLLYFSRRILPNEVLNRIEGQRIIFTSDKYIPENRIHLVGEHEVKEIVNKAVEEKMRRQIANGFVRNEEFE